MAVLIENNVTLPKPTHARMGEILQTKSLYISAGHSHSDPDAAGNGHTEEAI